MIPFNPEYQEHLPTFELAKKLDKGITIKKGFYSGFLNEENKTESIKDCLQTPLKHSSVSSLVVGTITPDNFTQNISLLNEINHG